MRECRGSSGDCLAAGHRIPGWFKIDAVHLLFSWECIIRLMQPKVVIDGV